MKDYATSKISEYIMNKGITVSVISKATGIPDQILYRSISGESMLRADEFLKVCNFIERNPFDFMHHDAS